MIKKFLQRSLTLLLVTVASAQQPSPPMVIRWVGSAYEEGDAFKITAKIGAEQVDLNWDGFSGPHFDFMDESKKQRITKDFVVKDPATVKAFRVMAEQAELCDAGASGVLGQGVSVDALVEVPAGTVKREMNYFVTGEDRPMAARFAALPWLVKSMLDAKQEALVPPGSGFSKRVRNLATALSDYDEAFRALDDAFENGENMPSTLLGGFLKPLTLARYMELHGDTPGVEKSRLEKWLTETEGILRDALGPANRAVFIGEEVKNPGIVVRMAPYRFGLETPLSCLSMDLGTAEDPVTSLSLEGENLLMHFITGIRLPQGMLIGDVCSLGFTDDGTLVISSDLSGNLERFDDSFIKGDRVKARLEYLKDRDIGGLLLGNGKRAFTPVMVRIRSIMIHPENRDRAKLDFSKDRENRVVELTRTGGRWTPGKVWDARDYHMIDGVYHGDDAFRRDDK